MVGRVWPDVLFSSGFRRFLVGAQKEEEKEKSAMEELQNLRQQKEQLETREKRRVRQQQTDILSLKVKRLTFVLTCTIN